jgi:iron complex transport system substrate-binding protein
VAARPRKLARLRLGLVVLLAALAAAGACRRGDPPSPAKVQRIVSLVPAVTEMLYAIGAGPQVVGVSSYDHFPPDVESLPKVGALVDPDTERIFSLRPDLVVVYGSQSDVEARFDKAGIQTFNYRHSATDAILGTFDTITALGAATGHEAEARELVVRMTTALDDLRKRVAGLPRPRTLVVIGRQPGTLQGVYAAGGSGFMNEMLEIAGGQNVLEEVKRESVQPSSETLLRLAPDVLLELKATAPAGNYPGGDLEVWNTLASIPAVQNKQVRALVGDYVVVPGPRIPQGAEAIARALHPATFP